jgi:hypothetical protein
VRGDRVWGSRVQPTVLSRSVSRYPADAGLDILITELRQTSEPFADLWTSVPSAVHTSDCKIIQHPLVGELVLDCDVLTVPGADLRLVTYTTTAGGSDAGKLDLLKVTAGHRVIPELDLDHPAR